MALKKISEWAFENNMSRQYAYELIKYKRLKGVQKVAGMWMVDEDKVEIVKIHHLPEDLQIEIRALNRRKRNQYAQKQQNK